MSLFASTTGRVPSHTAHEINMRIAAQTERNIAYYAAHPEKITQRIEELEHEWDIERTLEANAATVSLASVVMGLFVSRKFLFLPGIVSGFLMQHAIQGWCPPLPLFRRMGIRTQTEIERERFALKALRGDFSKLADVHKEIKDPLRLTQRIIELVK